MAAPPPIQQQAAIKTHPTAGHPAPTVWPRLSAPTAFLPSQKRGWPSPGAQNQAAIIKMGIGEENGAGSASPSIFLASFPPWLPAWRAKSCSQPSYTAEVIWPVRKVSITRTLGCTLLLCGLLSELVYDFCNDKEPLANGIKKCIQKDTLEAPLNYTGFQQAPLNRMIFPSEAMCYVKDTLWTLTAAYIGVPATKQQRKQPHSKSRFNTLESSTSTQPGLHTCATKLLRTSFNAVNKGIRNRDLLMHVMDPGWIHTWRVSLKIRFHWKRHFHLEVLD